MMHRGSEDVDLEVVMPEVDEEENSIRTRGVTRE